MEGNWKLIHYHEDGRNELYNLALDVGEQNDLFLDEQDRAGQMKQRLDQWLMQTNAKFPSKDPTFDSTKRSDRWKQIKTQKKAGLEKQHARYLSPNYKPNKDWWGSSHD
jgi:hypothetical protein